MATDRLYFVCPVCHSYFYLAKTMNLRDWYLGGFTKDDNYLDQLHDWIGEHYLMCLACKQDPVFTVVQEHLVPKDGEWCPVKDAKESRKEQE